MTLSDSEQEPQPAPTLKVVPTAQVEVEAENETTTQAETEAYDSRLQAAKVQREKQEQAEDNKVTLSLLALTGGVTVGVILSVIGFGGSLWTIVNFVIKLAQQDMGPSAKETLSTAAKIWFSSFILGWVLIGGCFLGYSVLSRRPDYRRFSKRQDRVALAVTRLKALRKQKGLSVKQLAQLSQLDKGTIERIEAGQNRPYFSTLHKLTQVLGVAVDEELFALTYEAKQGVSPASFITSPTQAETSGVSTQAQAEDGADVLRKRDE